jgi:hypothetical protein
MPNVHFSNLSCSKLLILLHVNEFEIPAPKYSTHFCTLGNCDALDIVVHKNVWLPEVIVTDILKLENLLISTCWIILELGIIRTRLTNSQV